MKNGRQRHAKIIVVKQELQYYIGMCFFKGNKPDKKVYTIEIIEFYIIQAL